MRALASFPGLRAFVTSSSSQYVAQKPENEAYIEHAQSCRGVKKILKFRPCESASEAVGDHHNICGNWSVNLGDSS